MKGVYIYIDMQACCCPHSESEECKMGVSGPESRVSVRVGSQGLDDGGMRWLCSTGALDNGGRTMGCCMEAARLRKCKTKSGAQQVRDVADMEGMDLTSPPLSQYSALNALAFLSKAARLTSLPSLNALLAAADSAEQSGHIHSPDGTTIIGGLRQNIWQPRSHRSHRMICSS